MYFHLSFFHFRNSKSFPSLLFPIKEQQVFFISLFPNSGTPDNYTRARGLELIVLDDFFAFLPRVYPRYTQGVLSPG
jgi:hypothetical protein